MRLYPAAEAGQGAPGSCKALAVDGEANSRGWDPREHGVAALLPFPREIPIFWVLL